MATATSGSETGTNGELAPSTAIIEAVSAREGVSVTELPPLYEAVDPDALDALFADGQTFGAVTFEYAGYDVSVRADGRVNVSQIR